EDPRQPVRRGAGEGRLDIGERDVDDRDVEKRHEDGDRGHQQDLPAACHALPPHRVACFTKGTLHQSDLFDASHSATLTKAMLKRDYEGQVCSIARALEVVGDRWTLLVIRDVAVGKRRFEQLLTSLGVASNVLTDRLQRLVAEGILERVQYSERPARFEYRLTAKGRELRISLLALMQWGDRYISEKPPRIAGRRTDRSPVQVRLVAGDGSVVRPDELEVVPGPGAPTRSS